MNLKEKIWEGIVKHTTPLSCKDIEIIQVEPGYAKASLLLDQNVVNLNGFAHGGILYTLCEIVSGMATYAYGVTNVTMQGNINYMKAGIIGTTAIAECNTVHKGRKTAISQVKVLDNNDNLLVTASFTMFLKDTIE